jgi:TPR repeat protein
MLGAMYFEGVGVPKDYPLAFKLHLEAAQQGHPLAQYEVGAMYDRGVGVGKNQAVAVRWFRRAAEQGYGKAQVNLGAMYATGEGVPQDYVEAHKWFSIAVTGGGYMDNEGVKDEAGKRSSVMAYRMSSAQVAEAQARMRQWRARAEPLVPH